MKRIVIIDNYDSFTYNIYQMVSRLVQNEPDMEVCVYRSDEISVEELKPMNIDRLIISPGPGIPINAGISVEAIRAFADKVPVLGVCLGHQALAEAFGGRIVQAHSIVHGKVEEINIDGKGVFRGLPNPCRFTRYHSLAVDPASVPAELEISARAADGEIMGLRHRELPLEGVQFHPESIGSDYGERLFANFLNWRREPLDARGLLTKVIARQDLVREEAAAFMDDLTDGILSDIVIAAMLAALAAKGYTPEEVAGFASVLCAKCRPVELDSSGVLDTCGTGGDGKHTFNISSLAAVIVAACGVPVAKHGNRAVSSRSGSTDFYQALGIPVNLDPDGVKVSIKNHGFAYMAAPLYHSAMRHAGPVRSALGIKTIMNCLGPLANPARVDYQLIGVFEDDLLPVMARAARMLGVKRVLCVHSEDGLDELSPAAPSKLFLIDEKGLESPYEFNPADIGIHGFRTEDLTGGDGAENARTAMAILQGGGPNAVREAVCLNAGAALFAAARAKDIADGYNQAKAALDDGSAARKVEALRRLPA
ncbi:MAG: bifunctional glutamine amidotransferase/anthranilate phosphoribosyltransferase [Spirochaeta sp. LUC14_002_19_P3]|nr:MAG: bifunctional glutamine amidotransferase/anthranilate phosphoribosyltransferase [Spirochaeta sp. LUC14_002_19_P3]